MRILERQTLNGLHTIYRFDNNYGASVIKHDFIYGFELVVIEYDDDDDDITYFNICYDTLITNNILYRLSLNEVNHILKDIEKIKKKIKKVKKKKYNILYE